MAADAAAGMWHLHSRTPQILHEDLKSPNLLIGTNWIVKVVDMGIKKQVRDDMKDSSASRITSNPRWMAPEVLNAERHTAASDVFSFVIVTWELLVWKLPWGDTNHWSIFGKVLQGKRLLVPPRK